MCPPARFTRLARSLFPWIGWVEFEPTVSQLRIFRPSGETIDEFNFAANQAELEAQEQARFQELLAEQRERAAEASLQAETRSNVYWTYLIVLIVVVILLVVVFAWRKKRPSRLGTPLPVRLERSLRRMGIKSPPLLRRWVYLSACRLSPVRIWR
jgi:hypothetical protein